MVQATFLFYSLFASLIICGCQKWIFHFRIINKKLARAAPLAEVPQGCCHFTAQRRGLRQSVGKSFGDGFFAAATHNKDSHFD
jgi:hypothetical protein